MQKLLFFFILVIFVIHAVAGWESWYVTNWWLDIPMHMLGGAWIALLSFYLFEERFRVVPADSSRFLRFLVALGFVALVGIGWEVFEYAIGALAGQFPWGGGGAKYYFDSLLDLLDDLIGGFAAGLWWVYNVRHNGDTP